MERKIEREDWKMGENVVGQQWDSSRTAASLSKCGRVLLDHLLVTHSLVFFTLLYCRFRTQLCFADFLRNSDILRHCFWTLQKKLLSFFADFVPILPIFSAWFTDGEKSHCHIL
jgi:hypothetical protein